MAFNFFNELSVAFDFFKELKRLFLRLDVERHHIDFLSSCRDLGIIPKFLRSRSHFISANFAKEKFRFEFQCLKNHIRRKYGVVDAITKKIYGVKNNGAYNRLSDSCSPYEFDIAMKKIQTYRELLDVDLKHRMYGKLNFLSEGLSRSCPPVNLNGFLNLSSRIFTEKENSLLCKGPKFIPYSTPKPVEFVPQLEEIARSVPSEKREEVRNFLFMEYKKHLKIRRFFPAEDFEIFNSLKKLADIVFLKTDKSNKIAALDKSVYISRMKDTISDMGCTPVVQDPLNTFMYKVEKFKKAPWPDHVRELKKVNPLGIIPRMFGIVKDHKPNHPLRPVVARNTAPSFFLEKVLVIILKEILPDSMHSISSTTQFIEKLQNVTLPASYILATLDIVSLFPSINVYKARDNISSALINSNYSAQVCNTIVSAINLIIEYNFFVFDGTIYKQTTGTPMGSPISGLLAEFVLRPMEDNFLASYHIKPSLWLRFVDDTFVIWPASPQDFQDFVDTLNTQEPGIAFTSELENDNSISFLDVRLKRTADGILRDVYRKPVSTPHTIHKSAITPKAYKEAAYISYINRALRICSPEFIHEEFNRIRCIAVSNGFSLTFINELIIKVTRKLKHPPSTSRTTPLRIPVSYFQGFHEKVAHFLKNFDIQLVASSQVKLDVYLKSRLDPVPLDSKPGIYEIPMILPDGSRKHYVGLTSRKLKIRLNEHKASLKSLSQSSALSRTFFKDTTIDVLFQEARIIAPYTTHTRSSLRESIEINKRKNCICNQQDSFKIPNIWLSIL